MCLKCLFECLQYREGLDAAIFVYVSLILLDGKEVLALKLAIFWQICAMDSILASVDTVSSSEGIRAQVLGYFWVHRSDKVAEGLDSVFLADLHHDAGTSRHLLSHLSKFGEHSLVNLEELFSSWSIKMEHLQS